MIAKRMLLPLLAALAAAASPARAQHVLAPQWMQGDAAALAARHPSLTFDFYENSAQARELVPRAEAFIGTPDAALMEAGENLRWVHVFAAGIENQAGLPGLADGRVTLTNLKIHQGPEIADHAFALLLHLTRNLGQYQRAQDRREWQRGGAAMPLVELRGRTLLVLGYGGIGVQVAERGRAFGMKVHAIDLNDIPLTLTLERSGKPDELADFLPLADVVVCCLPLTPETEGMLDAEAFGRMKPGSYFINVSRGRIADGEALVRALEEGRLAGAGLDVVDPEPLPEDSPLWDMENVILTPHVAGVSDGRPLRQAELLRDNLSRFARGLPLKNVADPARGF